MCVTLCQLAGGYPLGVSLLDCRVMLLKTYRVGHLPVCDLRYLEGGRRYAVVLCACNLGFPCESREEGERFAEQLVEEERKEILAQKGNI